MESSLRKEFGKLTEITPIEYFEFLYQRFVRLEHNNIVFYYIVNSYTNEIKKSDQDEFNNLLSGIKNILDERTLILIDILNDEQKEKLDAITGKIVSGLIERDNQAQVNQIPVEVFFDVKDMETLKETLESALDSDQWILYETTKSQFDNLNLGVKPSDFTVTNPDFEQAIETEDMHLGDWSEFAIETPTELEVRLYEKENGRVL